MDALLSQDLPTVNTPGRCRCMSAIFDQHPEWKILDYLPVGICILEYGSSDPLLEQMPRGLDRLIRGRDRRGQ